MDPAQRLIFGDKLIPWAQFALNADTGLCQVRRCQARGDPHHTRRTSGAGSEGIWIARVRDYNLLKVGTVQQKRLFGR